MSVFQRCRFSGGFNGKPRIPQKATPVYLSTVALGHLQGSFFAASRIRAVFVSSPVASVGNCCLRTHSEFPLPKPQLEPSGFVSRRKLENFKRKPTGCLKVLPKTATRGVRLLPLQHPKVVYHFSSYTHMKPSIRREMGMGQNNITKHRRF